MKFRCQRAQHSGRKKKSFLGEHKVMTPKQQFLGIILCFFMYVFEMALAIVFLCKNAVERFFSPSHDFRIFEKRTNTSIRKDNMKSHFH